MLQKIRLWSAGLSGLARVLWLTSGTLLCAVLAVVVFPYIWPFGAALVFSAALHPFVRWIEGLLRHCKGARSIGTLLGMLLLFGVVGAIGFWLLGLMGRELTAMAKAVPDVIAWVRETALPYLQDWYGRYRDIWPESAFALLNRAFSAVANGAVQMAASLSGTLASGALTTATSLPGALLSIVVTLMGTYYLTADRARIFAFIRRWVPQGIQRTGRLLKDDLFRALLGQIKSQLLVSGVIIAYLMIAFSLYGLRYGLLLGLIIGVLDALPVLGAGLFLLPWSLFGFLFGKSRLGVFMLCLYLGTIVIRQVIEPRIVGRHLGLYPLATMMAMFAGYRLIGFLGLLLGPVLLNLLKVVLQADQAARQTAR